MAADQISFLVLLFALFFGTSLAYEGFRRIEFAYTGSKGPQNWGNLDPNFSACSTGKMQSPVNIMKNNTVFDKKLKSLTRHYYPAKAVLVTNGFNIGMHYEEYVGGFILNGKNYSLKQMHWHSPSEHRIDGVQYPAELHLVHFAIDGSIDVVSILYQYGHPDPLLTKIKKKLDELAKEVYVGHEDVKIPVAPVYVKPIKRRTRKYYQYIGSLTTPPCTENVTWNILGKVRTISREQVDALKSPLHAEFKNNSRPLQPCNGRHLELYDDLVKH